MSAAPRAGGHRALAVRAMGGGHAPTEPARLTPMMQVRVAAPSLGPYRRQSRTPTTPLTSTVAPFSTREIPLGGLDLRFPEGHPPQRAPAAMSHTKVA